jgi:hypothetical protein
MANDIELTEAQRENLVAYLDGELDEDNSRQIEQVLAASPTARREVEVLMGTWEMLDVLPQREASEQFVEDTMATIELAKQSTTIEHPLTDSQPKFPIKTVAVWMTGLAVSAIFGFFITNQLIPNPSETLVQELPLINELHLYSEVDSLEFLTELQQAELFEDDNELNIP